MSAEIVPVLVLPPVLALEQQNLDPAPLAERTSPSCTLQHQDSYHRAHNESIADSGGEFGPSHKPQWRDAWFAQTKARGSEQNGHFERIEMGDMHVRGGDGDGRGDTDGSLKSKWSSSV